MEASQGVVACAVWSANDVHTGDLVERLRKRRERVGTAILRRDIGHPVLGENDRLPSGRRQILAQLQRTTRADIVLRRERIGDEENLSHAARAPALIWRPR